jgi:hypothetical protein
MTEGSENHDTYIILSLFRFFFFFIILFSNLGSKGASFLDFLKNLIILLKDVMASDDQSRITIGRRTRVNTKLWICLHI